MNVVLWIAAGVLAAVFLLAGLRKLATPRETLASTGMGWAESWPDAGTRLLGAVEVLGAVGLVLPALVDVAPVLVPWAAVGLGLTMLGAVVVHVRRREAQPAVLTVVLLALAVLVAWGRFGTYAF